MFIRCKPCSSWSILNLDRHQIVLPCVFTSDSIFPLCEILYSSPQVLSEHAGNLIFDSVQNKWKCKITSCGFTWIIRLVDILTLTFTLLPLHVPEYILLLIVISSFTHSLVTFTCKGVWLHCSMTAELTSLSLFFVSKYRTLDLKIYSRLIKNNFHDGSLYHRLHQSTVFHQEQKDL